MILNCNQSSNNDDELLESQFEQKISKCVSEVIHLSASCKFGINNLILSFVYCTLAIFLKGSRFVKKYAIHKDTDRHW